MAGIAIDTSVLVAALLSWHSDHERAFIALEAELASPEGAVLPLHALTEAYAVMTRLPPPRRLSPGAALAILRDSFRESVTIATLEAEDIWTLLDELAGKGVAGGTTYDAIIAAAARKAGCRGILTLNPRHFSRLTMEGLEVRTP